MTIVANILIIIVALLHFYFLVLEMYFWTKPIGLKIFAQSQEKADSSAVLAANQGLYNGFLVAGLVWGLCAPDQIVAFQFKIFFLSCVVIAGTYGGISVNKRIIYVQAMPALIALFSLVLTLA